MRTLGRAATTECCSCHYIFSKPEMHKVRRISGGGYQHGRRTDRYNKLGERIGHSQSEGYWRKGRTVFDWYCADCYATYVRSKYRTAFGYVVVLAIIMALYLDRRPTSKVDEKLPSFAESQSEATGAPTDLLKLVEPRLADAEDGYIETGSPTRQEDRVAIPAVAEQADTPSLNRITPESSASLRAAISKALTTGNAERWREDGSEGYVVVSVIEPQSGCRSVYYSIDTEHPIWMSPVQTICPDQQ